MSTVSFSEAVASRCGKPVQDVEAVLRRNGIVPDPVPPAARHLRVSRVMFSGTKILHGESEEFKFEWNGLDDGLWIIATEDNLVGKSSILQVILWALRGSPKSLANDVRHWLARVEVEFVADNRRVQVHFDVAEGVASGTVAVAGEPKAQQFSNDESFKRVMQDVMLPILGLEPIAATQQRGIDKDVVRYDDGWLSYTGAFLSDARSDAIIGENIPNTNITQRFLQVFLGIPWATTYFQARAAKRVLESEESQRKRKLDSLGGRKLEKLEADLHETIHLIEDKAARDAAVSEIVSAQSELDTVQGRIGAARELLSELKALVEDSKESCTRAERALLDIEEEKRSAAFFKQLEPVECPRCSTKITSARRELERTAQQCSVCATAASPPDPETLRAELADAEESLKDARKRLHQAENALNDVQSRLQKLLLDREVASQKLSELGKLGTAVDVQVLERQRERLEGMLEIARIVIGEAAKSDGAIEIVTAAELEAESRTKDSAEVVLDRVSQEVTRIVKTLGAHAVDHVAINRAAQVKVTKGGVVTHFSSLSDGEQLRLRIATVLALMHTAKDYGTGRHPGLLIIDSPGNAEMKGQNVSEAIREIAEAVKAVQDVQVFVGMRGVALAQTVVSENRVVSAGDGQRLW